VPLSSVSIRPAFSGSGWIIVIRLDAGLSTVFPNVGTTLPMIQYQHPNNTFVLSPGLERSSM
jgi:hypothetical protein